MIENWVIIDEFPNYSVSDRGRVLNNDTRRILRESVTHAGLTKVGLVSGGKQFTRGVASLVANSFVEGRSNMFDTIIHLDGEPYHNHAFNLAWRPRWFSWRYKQQFRKPTIHHTRGPIVESQTREKYVDMFDAAISNGLLVDDVRRSVMHGQPCFPTDQQFEFFE